MSDFTDSLVAMKDATEELVQAKEVFESIYEGYQGALDDSIQTLRDLERYAQATGKNTLAVASAAIVSDLALGDELYLLITETNDTALVSLDVNGQGAKSIVNVTAANQLFAGALVKVRYDGTAFYVIEQVNPKTGNAISDIGKLVIDTTDMLSIGEVALNGAEISREEYSITWAKIKNTSNLIDQVTKDADPISYGGFWGEGDGSTTFTLPIVGGEFIRMFDDGRGVDDERGFASYQEDAIRNIIGDFGNVLYQVEQGGGVASGAFLAGTGAYGAAVIPTSGVTENNLDGIEFDASRVVPVANENRPRSIAYYGKTRL
ncbi:MULTISPECIES: hypothetical protein [unclassified Marinomonas]|uniref:hypothetical protein n=1 Tax=unclassified Marinomonas TaxID=196814 RepID=UPI0007AF5358|nr:MULTISPECIES: hypothetical protein [unclassified Marinomonas]